LEWIDRNFVRSLNPRKQTFGSALGMSALCQKRTQAVQQNKQLFNHLIGNG
jgi:hypothetical protein